ncbi:MAG: hypothetical protein B5M54_10545 [Candidatus Aminicenantes bacterium 4484_214]|nr:MAG: hypothetical protein B5M54_10545 [Candidatus Aminicenantes bacterium 4484_214]
MKRRKSLILFFAPKKEAKKRFSSIRNSKSRQFIFLLCLFLVFQLFSCEGEPNDLPAKPFPPSNTNSLKPANLSSLKPEVSFQGQIVFHSNLDGDHELYLLTKDGLKKLTDNSWDDVCGKWSPDGQKIAFAANPEGKYEIFTIQADGTHLSQVTTNLQNPIGHAGHAWNPDGRSIVYTVQRSRGIFRRHWMETINLETKKTKRFMPEFKQHAGIPDFSPTSPLVAFTGKRARGWDAAVFNLETRESKFLTEGGKSCRPHFSHDGQKLAYVSAEADGKADIWLMNPDGTGKKRLTNRDETYDYFPAWSPDDRYIVFSSVDHYGDNLKGNWALYLVEVATGKTTLLFDSPGGDLFPHWRPARKKQN